jgi:hypothetical protein
MQERPLLKIELATGTPREGVNRVMAVFRAESVQHHPALVSLAVAVRVAQEDQIGLL